MRSWFVRGTLAALAVSLVGIPTGRAGGGKRYNWKQRPNQAGLYDYGGPLLRNLPRGKVVRSRIRRVDVYLGRALIVRQAPVTLSRGNHRLVFPALPWNIEASTLSLAGFGRDAVAGSTFLEEGTLVEARPKALVALERKRKQMAAENRRLANRIAVLASERATLLKALTSPSVPWTHDTIKRSLSFLRAELGRITRTLGEVETKRRALAPLLRRVTAAHGLLLGKLRRKVRHVVVEVRVKRPQTLRLTLRYVVHGPTWKPRHEGRYDAVARTLRLDTYAWVVQKTGETWDNVAIRISNARPTSGLLPPATRRRTVVLRRAGARRAGVSRQLRELANYASGSSTHAVRFFSPPGRYTVASNPQGRRLRVASVQMKADAAHLSTPMEHPGAFLRLRVTNPAKVALLPGEAALFNGTDYVGTARVPAVLPGEQLVLPFGRDPRVSVSRQRFRRDRVVRGYRQTLRVAFRFRVKNAHPYPIRLELREVLPRPEGGGIRVTMTRDRRSPLRPKRGPRTAAQGTWLWALSVAPGQTRSWDWGYSVSAPAKRRIVGVD